MKKLLNKPALALFICFVILIGCVIGVRATLTSGESVALNELFFPLPSGETIRVIEFRPQEASVANPLPAIVLSHGNDSSAERLQEFALELSKRGFIVFCNEMTSAGRSSVATSPDTISSGMYDLLKYVHDSLNYVDSERIGITGYSAGGNNTMDVLIALGRQQREAPDSYVRLASAAFIMAPRWIDMSEFATGINVGLDVGMFDPYSRRSFSAVEGYYPGDLTVKPEVKGFINLGVPGTFSEEDLTNPQVKVEIKKVYGSFADGTGRIVYNAATSTHATGNINADFVAECVDYFSQTLGAPRTVEPGVSASRAHIAFAFIGLIMLLLTAIPLTLCYAKLPLFQKLVSPAPEPFAQLKTGRDKILFLVVSLIVAFASPLMAPTIFTNATTWLGSLTNWFILGSTANSVMVWIFAFGVINLIVALLFYFLIHRRNGVRLANFGTRLTLGNILRALLLAVMVFGTLYAFAALVQDTLHVDFRYNDIAFPVMTATRMGAILRYVPVYLLFWLVNSFVMNGLNRFKGMNECVNVLLCIACSVIGILVIAAIYYISVFTTGTGLGDVSVWKVYMNLMYMMLLLVVGTVFCRVVYLKTGNIYLGPVIFAVFITVLCCSQFMLPSKIAEAYAASNVPVK